MSPYCYWAVLKSLCVFVFTLGEDEIKRATDNVFKKVVVWVVCEGIFFFITLFIMFFFYFF